VTGQYGYLHLEQESAFMTTPREGRELPSFSSAEYLRLYSLSVEMIIPLQNLSHVLIACNQIIQTTSGRELAVATRPIAKDGHDGMNPLRGEIFLFRTE
jgi:hypothetical protein